MLILTFHADRITKGTIVFVEPPQAGRPAVGTLYITKAALAANGLDGATELTVTITKKTVGANDVG